MSTHYDAVSRQVRCNRGMTGLLALFFAVVLILHPGVVLAEEDTSASGEAGLGIGSGLLTLVYFPVKVVYAVLGSVVGGFTYALTGGDLDTAKTVWEPSVYGTYVITPDHLKGNEAVRFYGVSPYEEEQ
ncbi:MAG: hypothetical protein ACPGYT_06710 [Nitrospirales bacterium]